MIKVYGIKNCDSVKKALKFFKEHGLEYELIDFKTSPVGSTTVEAWLQQVPLKTLFNTRGTTYRTLGLKAMDLDDAGKAKWLSTENMLIKRPVIEYNGDITVGFDQTQYEGVFLS